MLIEGGMESDAWTINVIEQVEEWHFDRSFGDEDYNYSYDDDYGARRWLLEKGGGPNWCTNNHENLGAYPYTP